jgi:hypothetical protein
MRIRETIATILLTISFFWIVGTVGALECDNITFLQAIVQAAIGIIVGCIGLACGNVELE